MHHIHLHRKKFSSRNISINLTSIIFPLCNTLILDYFYMSEQKWNKYLSQKSNRIMSNSNILQKEFLYVIPDIKFLL